MKKLLSLLLAMLILLSLGTSAYADGAVYYDGDADRFIFYPGSDHSLTDLFTELKTVMPGDVLTDQVLIKNISSKNKVRVFMRSLGAIEGTDEFLSQMTLTVHQVSDSPLFEAPANETAQLTDWVFLGIVYPDGEISLNLSLEVPITLDDKFQNKVGYIDWEFMVEEIPYQYPQTGDNSGIYLYSAAAALSMTAMLVLVLIKRKKA